MLTLSFHTHVPPDGSHPGNTLLSSAHAVPGVAMFLAHCTSQPHVPQRWTRSRYIDIVKSVFLFVRNTLDATILKNVHLPFSQRRSNFCFACKSSSRALICLVTKERFGLAHALIPSSPKPWRFHLMIYTWWRILTTSCSTHLLQFVIPLII